MITFSPLSISHLQTFLKSNEKQFSIKGSGYSYGGHTENEHVQIDMKNINHIQIKNDSAILGSGCTWYDVIKETTKQNKCPCVMQSYYNFSVGGSISVNCHGREIKYSTISNTIMCMKIVLSNGEIVECSREKNVELFDGVIGGYGLLGIIVEATIILEENYMITCTIIESKKFPSQELLDEKNLILYNTYIFPKTDVVKHYLWKKTDKKVNNELILKQKYRYHWTNMFLEQLVRISDSMKKIRPTVEASSSMSSLCDDVYYKSYECTSDANELEPLIRFPTTTILQEYFVPVGNFLKFKTYLLKRLEEVNVVNISVRYVKKIKNSVLNYAPVDSYAFVLYLNIFNTNNGKENLKKWTTENINFLLKCGGKYYLPYLQSYEKKQIALMYDLNKMIFLKKRYDPFDKIFNKWYFNFMKNKN
jgi:hypothetical protein